MSEDRITLKCCNTKRIRSKIIQEVIENSLNNNIKFWYRDELYNDRIPLCTICNCGLRLNDLEEIL